MKEINRDRLRALFDDRVLELYAVALVAGDQNFSLPRKQAIKLIVKDLINSGFTPAVVAHTVGLTAVEVHRIAKATESYSRGFNIAVRVFKDPVKVLERSEEYAYDYYISKSIVETIIIEDLAKAGWETNQIHAATKFGKRRIQRIKKRLREDEDE